MGKSKTPSFVLELELQVNKRADRILDSKRICANAIYDAALGEALKRLHKLQQDREYQALEKKLRKTKVKKERKPIYDQINILKKKYNYSEYELHSYITDAQHHFSSRINSNEAQKLATRAFNAVEKLRIGKAKKVRFRSRDEDISIEGKNNTVYPLFRDGMVWLDQDTPVPVILKKGDSYAQLAIQSRVKYIRILCRTIRGRRRWFVQLILEGIPPRKKREYGKGVAGIDEGVSTIAVVSDNDILFEELAPGTAVDAKKVRRLQRAIDRSTRATNPDNYKSDGTLKPKKQRSKWVYSKRCLRLKAELRELHRKSAAKRRQSHEELANRILRMADTIVVEEMNIAGLARRSKKTSRNMKNGKINSKKRFGKAVAIRAPATLISIINRKLGYIGKKIIKIDARAVKASQLDHVTGEYTRKPLKQRHADVGGYRVQRDLYSAFLIKHAAKGIVNRKACADNFEQFVIAQNKVVESIRSNGSSHMRWYASYPEI